jgi:hypothetical protein
VNVPAGYNGSQKIRVKAVNCKGSSSDRDLTITRLFTPATPGTISGNSGVCKSQTKNYSVPNVAGTTYAWSVTGGAFIFSGQGSSSVNIRFTTATSTTAVISVTASNACGVSSPRTKTVNVNLGCKVSDDAIISNESTDIFENLTVYPNPTSGKVNITFNAIRDAKYSLKVIDMIGKIQLSTDVNMTEGYNSKELNLEYVAKGIYLISIQTEGLDAKVIRLVVE